MQMEANKDTKLLLSNLLKQCRQLDFVVIARIFIERIQFPDLNMKSLEYYAENGQFGEADKGVNFCVVK